MDPQLAQGAIANYFKFICEKNPEAWVALFSEGAVSYDPVGNPANDVRRSYQKFFELLRFYSEMESVPTAMFFGGQEVAVHWEMRVTAINGKSGQTSGISVFTFDEAGKISCLKAYWDDRKLMAQLR